MKPLYARLLWAAIAIPQLALAVYVIVRFIWRHLSCRLSK
jgi:hypothetical protein